MYNNLSNFINVQKCMGSYICLLAEISIFNLCYII